MNVFIIPSWYPSPNSPLSGVFFREQTQMMAQHYPESNFGISSWGQNDERLLLWAGKPIDSFQKWLKPKPVSFQKNLDGYNIKEYFQPTYTWSSKLRDGNMNQIINANLKNFKHFENDYGKVDLIHAHVGCPAGHIAENLASLHHIPYLITEHMGPFPFETYKKDNGKLKSALKRSYEGSKVNIAVSHSLASDMKSYGVTNIQVIPNLVSDDFFMEAPVRAQTKFTFLSIGRLVQGKGFELLLKAFSMLEIDCVLRIAGDGDQKNRLNVSLLSLDSMIK